jgi:hypothetical protein
MVRKERDKGGDKRVKGKIQRDDTRKAFQREMWDLDERGYRRR